MSDSEVMLQVDIIGPQGLLKSITTATKELILGRDPTCHISVSDLNISRSHLKISWNENEVSVVDLGSSNGTHVNKHKLVHGFINKVFPSDDIKLGTSNLTLKLTLLTKDQNKVLTHEAQPVAEFQPAVPEKVAKEFKKNEDVVKLAPLKENIARLNESLPMDLDFKNIGLNMPKYNHPTDHANEVLREAEYIKSTMIKSAEIKKEKIINEARIESQKIVNSHYDAYLEKVQNLIYQTKLEIEKLKYESDQIIHDKELKRDIEMHRKRLEKEHAMQMEIIKEKLQLDIMTEKNRILSEAQHEVMKKHRETDEQIFKQKKEHETQLKLESNEHNHRLEQLKTIYDNLQTEKIQVINFIESQRLEKENLINEIQKFQLEHSDKKNLLSEVTQQLINSNEEYQKIKVELDNYTSTKNNIEFEVIKLNKSLEELQNSNKQLNERHHQISSEIETLTENLEKDKKDKKLNIDQEIANYKKLEYDKFETFKANQAQSYEKLKESHIESIKKISLDLSQEIATKLELQFKSNPDFDFEKTLEIANFVIQVKSSDLGGGSSQHEEMHAVWKQRQKSEKRRIYIQTFAAYIAITVIGYFGYNQLMIDPLARQQREIAAQKQEAAIKNIYVPERTDTYNDNYVDLTLYTNQFYEKFTDENLQHQFMKKSTRQFLNRWRVNEEVLIKVISGSRAFVKSIKEQSVKLTKDRYKIDIGKYKESEQAMIKQHQALLGSEVRYQDYKKIEKEFFEAEISK